MGDLAYDLIHAGEILDYSCDWAAEADDLGSPSDTISTSSWAVTPIDDNSPQSPALTAEAIDGVVTTVKISGCEAGHVYRLVNTVVWSSGVKTKKTVVVRCD